MPSRLTVAVSVALPVSVQVGSTRVVDATCALTVCVPPQSGSVQAKVASAVALSAPQAHVGSSFHVCTCTFSSVTSMDTSPFTVRESPDANSSPLTKREVSR